MSEVTQILSAIEAGDPKVAAELLPLVYDELRKLAANYMVAESAANTLQPTALVHEAYLRLVGSEPHAGWNGRGHCFAAAAEAMRRILIDRARHRQTLKAGGNRQRVALADAEPALPDADVDLLALDEALTKLEAKDARKAAVVKFRFFAGLTVVQAAAALGVSVSTAEDDWAYARSWLRVEIGGADWA